MKSREEIIDSLNAAYNLLPSENEITDGLEDVINQLEEEWKGEFFRKGNKITDELGDCYTISDMQELIIKLRNLRYDEELSFCTLDGNITLEYFEAGAVRWYDVDIYLIGGCGWDTKTRVILDSDKPYDDEKDAIEKLVKDFLSSRGIAEDELIGIRESDLYEEMDK